MHKALLVVYLYDIIIYIQILYQHTLTIRIVNLKKESPSHGSLWISFPCLSSQRQTQYKPEWIFSVVLSSVSVESVCSFSSFGAFF